jgi:hypothetical protein
LKARNVKPADIHRQICEVYGENIMSNGMARKWVRKFEGRDNGRPRSTRRGYRNWFRVVINALIMVETVQKSSLRYGESDKKNNIF